MDGVGKKIAGIKGVSYTTTRRRSMAGLLWPPRSHINGLKIVSATFTKSQKKLEKKG